MALKREAWTVFDISYLNPTSGRLQRVKNLSSNKFVLQRVTNATEANASKVENRNAFLLWKTNDLDWVIHGDFVLEEAKSFEVTSFPKCCIHKTRSSEHGDTSWRSIKRFVKFCDQNHAFGTSWLSNYVADINLDPSAEIPRNRRRLRKRTFKKAESMTLNRLFDIYRKSCRTRVSGTRRTRCSQIYRHESIFS